MDNYFNEEINKIVLSAPKKNASFEGRFYSRVKIERRGDIFQASMFSETKVFHKNLKMKEMRDFLARLFGECFENYTAWDSTYEYSAKISKNGKILTRKTKIASSQKVSGLSGSAFSQKAAELSGLASSQSAADTNFNRQKNYIINEGDVIPVLADMGIFTKEGKVCAAMSDKFRQINRFLEFIADETKPGKIPDGTKINIIDFGCGKSYLTFLIYHYFTQIRKTDVTICGMDLQEETVEKCANAAKKYGYSNITFMAGDIGGLSEPPIPAWIQENTFNIVICLHACDTATDYALFNAVKWHADLILAVPCCQHELNGQMKPQKLDLFSEYGIIKERTCALLTDAIRAKLLEYLGYKTQVLEFIDAGHTPKNVLIRAKRTKSGKKEAALTQIMRITDEFSFKPVLYKLITESL
ncbi:MAG: SAM-dependent methyltransferase [Clostridiales bacterium]|nr:SAM-dependent methyltransferase [Clostridiales bacterium]